MKKEVVIAIIVGFLLGLVITFGVYRAQKSIREKQARDNATEQELPVNTQQPENILTLTQPENDSISEEEVITIAGITQKNALISIVSTSDDVATQADEFGNFSTEFNLDTGINIITVTSFEEDGNSTSKDLNIVYSTVKFEDEVESETDPTESEQ